MRKLLLGCAVLSLCILLARYLGEESELVTSPTPKERVPEPSLAPVSVKGGSAMLPQGVTEVLSGKERTVLPPPLEQEEVRHVVYEGYPSRDAFLETLADFCQIMVPDQWEEEQVFWETTAGRQKEIPWGELSPNRAISAGERTIIEALSLRYQDEIRFCVQEALFLLEYHSHEYVASIAPLPPGTTIPPAQETDLARLSDSEYSCIGANDTSGWIYPVRFYSADYPDLEAALERVKSLREARLRAAQQVILEHNG